MADVEATVEIGEIDFDDNDAKFKPQESTSSFTNYIIHNRYEKDSHRYMAGVTSPGGFQGNSVAFFATENPTLLWISDWTACKWRNPPEIPAPVLADKDWVLLDEHYEPYRLGIARDGVTPLYRISGTYVYGKRNPQAVTVKDLIFPRPPWLQNEFDQTMPENKLQAGLIDIGEGTTNQNPGFINL